jgi:four helix bundle protein
VKTKTFRDLLVWQRSMKLAEQVYAATRAFPRSEAFGLTSQVRRAAVSIPSNIAEGHGRETDKNFAQFLIQARGSLCELETQLELACALKMLVPSQSRDLLKETGEVGRMLNGLLRVLRNSERAPR